MMRAQSNSISLLFIFFSFKNILSVGGMKEFFDSLRGGIVRESRRENKSEEGFVRSPRTSKTEIKMTPLLNLMQLNDKLKNDVDENELLPNLEHIELLLARYKELGVFYLFDINQWLEKKEFEVKIFLILCNLIQNPDKLNDDIYQKIESLNGKVSKNLQKYIDYILQNIKFNNKSEE